MIGEWGICGNHIALTVVNQVLHPSAEEILGYISDEGNVVVDNTQYKNLIEAFPNIYFSKLGSKIKCDITNTDNNIIMVIYVERKGQRIPLDFVDGNLIDHCVYNDEWFYVSGSREELIKLLHDEGIVDNGSITTKQYINIIKNLDSFEKGTVNNMVLNGFSDKKIDISGELPSRLKAKLYKYQKTGYFWMRKMLLENNGCILGDEMGLGKTLQIIALLLELKYKGGVPILVVAPVSLLQNWKRECEKFAPSLNCFIHHGVNRTGRYSDLLNYDVVVISYSIAINDASLLSMINWKLVVLDEAQSIKNPNSDRTKFVKRIPREKSIAVTGTPFENHVTDVWSLVDFVFPGMFGTQSQYNMLIKDDLDGATILEPMLTPLMIRRLVMDVASDLPEKVVIPQPLIMTQAEAAKYEEYRLDSLNGGGFNLGALQKLRMLCAHISLCDESIADPFSLSVKYQRLCEILEEVFARNEKAIVFTSYQKMFDIFEDDLPNRFGIKMWCINGNTPVLLRQRIIDTYNETNGSALLILNPRAAGTGLNITSANHVIHYNLEWNPALEDQASARAYRRGQTKTVFVYRLYYENTVEQIVNDRIDCKREMAAAAVIGTDGVLDNKDDIIAALSLSPMKEV